MAPNQSDLAFARLIIELKIASQDVVKQSLIELDKLKKLGDKDLNLGVMMYRKKLINDEDLKRIKQRHIEKLKQPGKSQPKQSQPAKYDPKPAPKPVAKPAPQNPPKPVNPTPPQVANKVAQDPLIGRQFGSYIIRKLLGTGGMGKVYLGENPLLGKLAAIKVLSYNYAKDEHYLKRFYREARMAAALQHPNIVQVYDFGQEHHLNYLVMEYVDGETLEDKIKREKKLTMKEALRIHIDVLKGLKIAHEQEIVHRDIKPENIMITTRGEIKLTDMGLARHKDPTESEALTIEGQALGTPRFMAPEQALGEQIDPRTDLYALGISLYHSICGEFPYPGKKPVEILRNMLRNEPVQLKVHMPEVSSQINNIVMKLISKSKAHRFSDADLTIKALERCQQSVESPVAVIKPPVEEVKPVMSSVPPRRSPDRKAPLPPKTNVVQRAKSTKKESSNSLLVILIVMLILLLIAAAIIIYMLVNKDNSQAYHEQSAKNQSIVSVDTMVSRIYKG